MDDTGKDLSLEAGSAGHSGHANHNGLERFFSAERRRNLDPELVLDRLGLKPGMVMADIGSGPGYFVLPAARRVGPTGRVYAVDVDQTMLDEVVKRTAAEGLGNVTPVLSQEDRLPLPDGVADTALLANVLHEVSRPDRLLGEVARVVRPGGSIVVVEWKKESQGWGPPPQHRLANGQVEALLRGCGCRDLDLFEVGPHHYGIAARIA